MHSKFVWVNHHDYTMYVWEEFEFCPLLIADCSNYTSLVFVNCLLYGMVVASCELRDEAQEALPRGEM